MDSYTEPEWQRSALITIDTQEDFTRSTGAACIAGTADVLPAIVSLLSAFRAKCLPVIHVVRFYLPDGSNVDTCRRAAIEKGRRVVVPGSFGAELAVELKPSPNTPSLDCERLLSGELQELATHEWALYKPRWGAFFNTKLEGHLRALGITTVVISGCNFPNCPRTTVYEASERDYRVVVVSDAISGVYDRGVAELRAIGVEVLTTSEVISALQK